MAFLSIFRMHLFIVCLFGREKGSLSLDEMLCYLMCFSRKVQLLRLKFAIIIHTARHGIQVDDIGKSGQSSWMELETTIEEGEGIKGSSCSQTEQKNE
jgi:hypothetical protein